MGYKSTVRLTRENALFLIQKHLSKASDYELADALEGLIGEKTLNNFSIEEVDSDLERELSWFDPLED